MSRLFVDDVMELVVARNPGETEFHQAVREVADSVSVPAPAGQESGARLRVGMNADKP